MKDINNETFEIERASRERENEGVYNNKQGGNLQSKKRKRRAVLTHAHTHTVFSLSLSFHKGRPRAGGW